MRDNSCDKVSAIGVALYLSTYQFAFEFDISLIALVVGGLFLLSTHGKNTGAKNSTATPDFLVFFFTAVVIFYSAISQQSKINLILSASFFPATFLYIILSRSKTNINYFLIIYIGIFLGAFLSSLVFFVFVIKFGVIDSSIFIKNLPPSIFIVPNDLLVVSIAIPFILSLLIISSSIKIKIFLSAGLVLCLAAVLISGSRSVIAITIIICYVTLVLHKRKFFLSALAAIFALIAIIDAVGIFSIFEKIKNYSFLCETRVPLWVAAWDLWSDSIFLGHGAYSYVDLYKEKISSASFPACSLVDKRLTPWPHNLYLELLSSYGLLGTIPFVLLMLWSLVRTYQLTKAESNSIRILAIGNFSALIGLLLAAMIELTLLRYWVVILTFTIFSISAALKILSENNLRNPNEKITT